VPDEVAEAVKIKAASENLSVSLWVTKLLIKTSGVGDKVVPA
jgi:hypothetical protein